MRAMGTFAARPPPRFLDAEDGSRLVHLLRQERATGSIVQIIGAGVGEGTSSLARDLALVAARDDGLRVLLLDLDPSGDAQLTALRDQFGLSVAATTELVGPPGRVVIHQLSCGDLHVSEAPRSGLHRLSDYVGQFPRLRSEFDLVLIDSPPVQRSYDGILMARQVDTNLLLVEAEKTRSAVAQNLRDRILDAGGHISGVVLNKRRFHIPGFIYRRV